MTDQLETDLRAMLAARAAEVTADPAAARPRSPPDSASVTPPLAEIVPLARPAGPRLAHRRRGGGRGRGDPRRWRSGPPVTRHRERRHRPCPRGAAAIFTGVGSPEERRRDVRVRSPRPRPGPGAHGHQRAAGPDDPRRPDRRHLAAHGEVRTSQDPAGGTVVLRDLGGGEWEVVESYSDGASIDQITRTATTITVRSTGPAGSHLSLASIGSTVRRSPPEAAEARRWARRPPAPWTPNRSAATWSTSPSRSATSPSRSG